MAAFGRRLQPLSPRRNMSQRYVLRESACRKPGLGAVTVGAGYWQGSNTSEFIQCFAPSQCPGGRPQACAGNRKGIACTLGDDGYRAFSVYGDCTPCPSNGGAVGLTVALFC